jgi:hypothetical protein
MKSLTIAQIIDKLENANIQVSEYKEDKKLCGYELNTYTDCGVNQIVFIDFRGKKMNPKSGKEFLELYNERINDIDINEEMKMHSEDKRYMQEIGYEVGIQDFKDWKENLQSIFVENKKTAEQRQFEQVQDKLRSQLKAMEETLEMMPKKGNTSTECQRQNILCTLLELDHEINGIELKDFTPNNYSGNFKLSYS